MLLMQPIGVQKYRFLKEIDEAPKTYHGGLCIRHFFPKSNWSSWLYSTWLLFCVGTEFARNWSSQQFQKVLFAHSTGCMSKILKL